LQDIIANKESLREKQKLPESDDNGLVFLGQKPEGVPADIDDMIRNQVAPVREVRCKKDACRDQFNFILFLSHFKAILIW